MMIREHRCKNETRMRVVFTLAAFALLFMAAGCKQEEQKDYPQDKLSVEYSINRENILIGDPVELIVTTLFPTNGVLELPEIGREKEMVLLQRDWEKIPREDGLVHSEHRYSITSFRLGEHVISTEAITCTVGDQIQETPFPQITLKVESSLDETNSSEIADIKPVQKLPGRIPRWIWIPPAAALIAFLVGLLTAKLWKNRENIIPAPAPVPPHVIAFSALNALKNKGLLEKGECNPFYTELSLILRAYLEGRFNLNAPDETTDEIVEEMSTSPELDEAQRNILQEFMRQADMVKFAKGHPDRSTMERAFETTKQFVQQTKNPTDSSDRSNQTDLN